MVSAGWAFTAAVPTSLILPNNPILSQKTMVDTVVSTIVFYPMNSVCAHDLADTLCTISRQHRPQAI